MSQRSAGRPEEEGGPGGTAVAQSLRHQSIQDVEQQEDRLAVSWNSVGERCSRVERRTDVTELGLTNEEESKVRMTDRQLLKKKKPWSSFVVCESLKQFFFQVLFYVDSNATFLVNRL